MICGDPDTGQKGIIEPRSWSDDDTPETVTGVKENNVIWKELCE